MAKPRNKFVSPEAHASAIGRYPPMSAVRVVVIATAVALAMAFAHGAVV